MSWQNKATLTWHKHRGRNYVEVCVSGDLTGPETLEMVKHALLTGATDPLYWLTDFGNTETVMTIAERTQVLDDMIRLGVTKLRFIFVIDQPFYEPMKLAYKMLMKTKDIDADLETFRKREDADHYLFSLMERESMKQREL